MWLSGGGSDGHSYEYALDVDECNKDGRGPQGWETRLLDSEDVKRRLKTSREDSRRQKQDAKVQESMDLICAKMHNGQILSRTGIQNLGTANGKNKHTNAALEKLVEVKVLKEVSSIKDKEGLRIAEGDTGAKKIHVGYQFDASQCEIYRGTREQAE